MAARRQDTTPLGLLLYSPLLRSLRRIGLRRNNRKDECTMKRTTAVLAVTGGLMLVASAPAAGPSVAWTKKDMTTAIHALGYPKPHPRKLACTGIGTTTAGAYDSFRCKATYRHHRIRRFVIGGEGEGGWLCAGKNVTGCKLLRHGFVTDAEVATLQSLSAAADLAARGYMQNNYGSYQPTGFCKPESSSTWSCGFTTTTVTITLKAAKGGYVEAAATS